MLTELIPPQTRNLLDPQNILERLKLSEDDLDEVTEQVEEVSALVALFLNFEPCFGTYQETFQGVRGTHLYLGARPAWSIVSVLDSAGSEVDATLYRLDRGPRGESALVRPGTWNTGSTDPGWPWTGGSEFSLIAGGAGLTAIPEWTVTYTAGWWLDGMEEGADPLPAGLKSLPPDVRADFLNILRWRRATQDFNPAVASLKNEGAEIALFKPADQDRDAATGIPCSLTSALALYRRPA